MKKIFTLLSLLVLTLSAVNAQIALYVNPVTGDDSGGDGTTGAPWKTLSRALTSAASSGDTIYVANGTITADGHDSLGIVINKSIVIVGNGPANTIVEGDVTPNTANRTVFTIPNGFYDVTIMNLTVRNGNQTMPSLWVAGGLSSVSAGKVNLENVVFSNNVGNVRGGGISHEAGKLWINNCLFQYNTGTFGGAIYGGSAASGSDSLVITNSTFYQNSAALGAGIFIERNNKISLYTNCTFYQNSATNKGGAVCMQDICFNRFTNCTIVDNTSTASSGGAGGLNKDMNTTCYLLNTIVADNAGTNGYADLNGGGGDFTSQGYNIIGNAGVQNYNLSSGDTVGINPGIDYNGYGNHGGVVPTLNLYSCSAAIDRGDAPLAPAADANNMNRFGNIDIGASEFIGTRTFPQSVTGIVGDTLVCLQSEGHTGLTYTFPRSIQSPNNNNYIWGVGTGGLMVTNGLQDSVVTVDLISTSGTSTEILFVASYDACSQSSPLSNFYILKPEIATMMGGTNPSCYGGLNGAATVNAFGSVGPYSYLWSDNSTSPGLSGIGAGTYTVAVTDIYGCVASDSKIVTDPPQLTINFTSSNIACFVDTCTGQISTMMTGGGGGGGARVNGTPTYSYSWNTGANTSFLDSLCEGTYTLTVTEVGPGCSATDSVTITRGTQMFANVTSTNVTCNGNADGIINTAATGGAGNYTYYWVPNGESTSGITNQAPGQYYVYVYDDNGCTIVDSALITEPSILAYNPAVGSLMCNGDGNGDVVLHVYGGIMPYTYSWSNGATTDSIGGLSGGIYTPTVTDANGCVLSTISFTVNEPSAMSVNLTQTNVTCNALCNGNAQAITSGGTQRIMASGNYLYSWSNGDISNVTDSLCAGTYNLTVTDQNGCILDTSVIITEPSALDITLTVTAPNCFGEANGQITSIVTGGTGTIDYYWLNTGDMTSSIDSLSANHYFLNISDTNGCLLSDSAYVIEPPDFVTSISKNDVACNASNGSITTTAFGGTTPYTYAWSDAETTDNISGLSVGAYSVVISDAHGCNDTLSASVISLGSNPVIQGMVYRGNTGDSIKVGVVEVYELTQSGVYTLYSTTNIDSIGHYAASVPVGQYIVLATANIATYPGTKPTYHGNTFRWDLATINNATCDSVLTSNINVIQLPILNGQATISGFVLDITVGKTTVQGDPIPGVDVALEQNPGSIMLAQTTTANDGSYQFNNVPVGTGYTIHVDIPGLPLVSTYTIDVTPATVSINNNFYVDSLSNIDTIPPVVTGVKHYAANVTKSILKTYPSPFKGAATLEVGLTDRSVVLIEVYNVLGSKVEILENSTKEKGLYTYSFGNSTDGYSAGVYYIRTTINGASNTLRVVKSE